MNVNFSTSGANLSSTAFSVDFQKFCVSTTGLLPDFTEQWQEQNLN
jgi:hypothetical protein